MALERVKLSVSAGKGQGMMARAGSKDAGAGPFSPADFLDRMGSEDGVYPALVENWRKGSRPGREREVPGRGDFRLL